MKRQKLNKEYIPITDDFMFCTVMEDEMRCKEFIDEPLANVLKYIQTGSVQDAFTADMEKQVEMLNTDEDWRERHMTLNMEYKHRYKLGYNAGHEDGIKDGREEGLLQGKEEGLKEGLKEGRKEGLKEGASKERDFIISNMLSKGFDAKVIMDVTGCDKKDITRIKEILLK